MREVKHTPGPWDVFPKESKTKVYCDDALGSMIADCTSTYTPLSMDAREANAKLIAAAPDMYNALQELVFGINISVIPINACLRIEHSVESIKKALAAIEKATT